MEGALTTSSMSGDNVEPTKALAGPARVVFTHETSRNLFNNKQNKQTHYSYNQGLALALSIGTKHYVASMTACAMAANYGVFYPPCTRNQLPTPGPHRNEPITLHPSSSTLVIYNAPNTPQVRIAPEALEPPRPTRLENPSHTSLRIGANTSAELRKPNGSSRTRFLGQTVRAGNGRMDSRL